MADEQLNQSKINKTKAPISKKIVNTPVLKNEVKKEEVKNEHSHDHNHEHKHEEVKKEEVKTETKKPEVKKVKKSESTVYGRSLNISLKQSKSIGKFIKNRKIDEAINNLEKVLKKQIAIPSKGEFAHQKGLRLNGKRMMSGKYPVNSSKEFIRLLKNLSANSNANGMDLDKTKISEVVINKAPKQFHRFGSTVFKRTHIMIKAKEFENSKINGGKK